MPKRDPFAFLAALVCAIVVAAAACSRATTTAAGASPAPAGAARSSALPPGITQEMVDAGRTIFNSRSCKNCHSVNGVGGVRGPDLTDDKWIHIDGSYDAIVSLVTTGFTKAQQMDPQYQYAMNPRGGVNLTDAEIRVVAAYVWSLSHVK
jgi:mono/diheme cytochrome c family protein